MVLTLGGQMVCAVTQMRQDMYLKAFVLRVSGIVSHHQALNALRTSNSTGCKPGDVTARDGTCAGAGLCLEAAWRRL